jgi:uncharacterized protein YkwD
MALVNSWRQQNALPALAYAGEAAAKAQTHAEYMAASGKLSHTRISQGLEGWSSWAENVGFATSADTVHAMLQASPGHNANMLSTSVTHIGVGAAMGADGNVYICQSYVG